jgi:DNA-binding NtrC family response regulator
MGTRSFSSIIEAGGKVLLVDDDRAFLSTVEAILSDQFDVKACESPREALRVELDEFDVVCADYNMPSMSGLELLDSVTQRSSIACCLLMTGADDFYEVIEPSGRRHPVIFKPIDPERLLNTVSHLASIAQMKRATTAMVGSSPPSSSPPSSRSPSSSRGIGPAGSTRFRRSRS